MEEEVITISTEPETEQAPETDSGLGLIPPGHFNYDINLN
jgi:hypothetical protein